MIYCIAMETFIIVLSSLNIMFFWIHELDACHKKEWRMFSFLSKLKEDIQHKIFLSAHIPLLVLSVYYLWSVLNFNNFPLWIIWNILVIVHLFVHLYAKKWKSNVFKSSFSFMFIYLTAITAFANLLLFKYY